MGDISTCLMTSLRILACASASGKSPFPVRGTGLDLPPPTLGTTLSVLVLVLVVLMEEISADIGMDISMGVVNDLSPLHAMEHHDN